MSLWLTTLSAIRRQDSDWEAIAPYEAPLRRFLARRARLSSHELDDLVQELLLAMKERLIERYDPQRGAFRSFLATAAHHRLMDYLRSKGRAPHQNLEADLLGEPQPAEVSATQLEADVLRALTAVQRRFMRSPERDVIYVFSGVLVDRLSLRQIAEREGLSLDQVKRRLGQARQALLEELFRGDRAAADLARACLRAPRRTSAILAEAPPRARESVEDFLESVSAARSTFGGGSGDDEFVTGLNALFESDA